MALLAMQTRKSTTVYACSPEQKAGVEKSHCTNQPNGAVDIDLDDPEVQGAATKIQAAFRGHKTRKETKQTAESSARDAGKPADPHPPHSQPSAPPSRTHNTLTDQELAELEQEFSPDDPDLNLAATRIQANFRGHMARKQQGKSDDELSKELEKLDAKVIYANYFLQKVLFFKSLGVSDLFHACPIISCVPLKMGNYLCRLLSRKKKIPEPF
ncbi:Hypothetical predicted protein [Cloeon dipterum]|uniref:Uncharacterized protein n=1 Tax=Cloeon dipterum TaxID=197152 RepID=A0A8S1BLI0_9INSE|nr:Hypothetical predicted protein [Cloeon dipterum]